MFRSGNKTPPVYTGPVKFLNGRIFYLCNQFTRNPANSVTDYSTVCRSILARFRVSRVKERRVRASFFPFKNLSEPMWTGSKAWFRRRSTHVPNLTDELSMAEEQRLNQLLLSRSKRLIESVDWTFIKFNLGSTHGALFESYVAPVSLQSRTNSVRFGKWKVRRLNQAKEDSLCSRRLEVVGTRKNGRARRRHACLSRARPFSLSPTTSKRLVRRLLRGRQFYFSLFLKLYFISKSLLQNKSKDNPQVAKAIRGGLCKNK